MVVDPEVLLGEIEKFRSGLCSSDLLISMNAHLIMPYHKKLDVARERLRGSLKIGTTGMGIGPAYEDKVSRCGIKCADLLSEADFRTKLKANLQEKNHFITNILHEEGFELQQIYHRYMDIASSISRHIKDTSKFLSDSIKKKKKILFEGAQGTLLDVDHGTYPYVTSSNTVAGEAATGSGIGPTSIDSVMGLTKAYATRVGEGPFPTELKGDEAARLREQGCEYGATTGRPRRCGWFDAVALRYSARINGLDSLALTKLDVLDSLDRIQVCTAYKYDGRVIEDFPAHATVLSKCEPVYETLNGWKTPTSGIKSLKKLEERPGLHQADRGDDRREVTIISIGADRKTP